jgi:hypothetical protein
MFQQYKETSSKIIQELNEENHVLKLIRNIIEVKIRSIKSLQYIQFNDKKDRRIDGVHFFKKKE